MKTRHVSKVIDVFSKNLFMSIRLMKKEIPGSHYFSFFALSNLLTQTCLHYCTTGQLFLWTCKMYIAYIVYYCICFPLCAHILYFDADKFSINCFHWYILQFLLSDNRMDMKKWLKRDPLRPNQLSLPIRTSNMNKNPDNRAVIWWNQIHMR